jgi:acyl-CoA synthetase (AMP-forming)/AMP-acid ligase II
MQDFVPRFAPLGLRRRWFAEGLWNDDTLASVIGDGAARHGSARARILSQARPYDGTVRDLSDQGARLAGALATHGISSGDVVAFQLPNWPEAIASMYGLLRAGMVTVPIVHIYGRHEMGHILRQSRARALITADRFGDHDYLAELTEIEGSLPDLELVVVVDAHGGGPAVGPVSLTWGEAMVAAEPRAEPAVVDPDSPSIVNYTSGTTSAAKGVVHSHRTFLAELRQGVAAQRGIQAWFDWAGAAERISPAPIGHMAGLLSALAPIVAGRNLHVLDRWDPGLVLRTMSAEGLAPGSGATVFLTSLLEHPEFDAAIHPPLMARFGLGGAPIPAEVARHASTLGISLIRGYGSTEHPSITMTSHADPDRLRTYTDGPALAGVEMRLVDDDGVDVGVGSPGEILARGPDLFIGYVDPSLTPDAIDAHGWYATGDIGVLDDEGYLTITDRKKDIIIRGGENISASEIEDLVLQVPGVLEVAVVAAPDPRYGEHGCAFVRLDDPTRALALAELRSHLEERGLARQKWPEELRVLDEFPRTPNGKIQKNLLRNELRAGTAPGKPAV